MDYSRQKLTLDVRADLLQLARATMVEEKIKEMQQGAKINTTENRAVMHIALRAPKDATLTVDGENVVPEVHKVLDKIYNFATGVREGKILGATSLELKNVVSIGIGGSYLGPEFVFEVSVCLGSFGKEDCGNLGGLRSDVVVAEGWILGYCAWIHGGV